MNERLKKLRKTLDLTQQEFADRLGIKRNTVAQYEIGRNEPIDAVIVSICREFNVSQKWLCDGIGEMFAPDDVLDNLSAKYGLSDSDLVLIKRYILLKSDARKAVINFIKDVASVLGNNNPTSDFDDVPTDPEEFEELYPPVNSDKINAG